MNVEFLTPEVKAEAQIGQYRVRVIQYPNQVEPMVFIQNRDGEEMGFPVTKFDALIDAYWREHF